MGPVPLGFHSGMDTAYSRVRPLLRRKVIVGGHSLSDNRATEFAGMLAVDKAPPLSLVVIGSPRAGTAMLQHVLAQTPARLYSNRKDPVCEVPSDPSWKHIRPFTALDEPP